MTAADDKSLETTRSHAETFADVAMEAHAMKPLVRARIQRGQGAFFHCWRQMQTQALQLGLDAETVARRLDRDPEEVRGWLERLEDLDAEGFFLLAEALELRLTLTSPSALADAQRFGWRAEPVDGCPAQPAAA